MKNVMVNVKTSFKKVMEQSKPYLKAMRPFIVGAILLMPRIVFAAGDPTGALTNGFNTLTNSLLIIAPIVGGFACVWFGLVYHFAGEAGEKAQAIKHMKTTAFVAGIIGIVPSAIGWIAQIFK